MFKLAGIWNHLKGDKVIWIVTLIMLVFSLVTVYSFVPVLVRSEGGTPMKYLMKHFVYVIIGLFAMFWIHKQNPANISRFSKVIFYLAIGLLIFTFFFGVRVNDASRWIRIPVVSLTFQTSDFAKLALVIYVSRLLVKKKDMLNNWKEGFMPIALAIMMIVGLIVKDNFSTAALLVLIAGVMLFIGKVPFKMLASFAGILVGAFMLVVLVHKTFPDANILNRWDTWEKRVLNQAADDSEKLVIDNIQSMNAELAIHNGGILGQGPGKGRLKLYTAEAYADFFYASFVEEFGLFGGVILVFVYLILLFRIIRIGLKSERLFETYLALGIGLIIMTQATVNMFVCTGLFPVTGQNMPILSLGGSALVMVCVSLGVIQSIARDQNGERVIEIGEESENEEN
jgi:cell division protein FtsW